MLKPGSTRGGGGQQLQLPQQCFVPQVWGTHVWKRPEIHPGLLRSQGSSHSAQDCCAENSPGGTALHLRAGEIGGEERGQAGTPGTALLYCSSSALGGSGHSGVEWSSVVISTVLAWSGMAYSCHSLKHRMPACPSHPIPPSHYISGPSSLAIFPLFLSPPPGLLQQQGLPQHAHLPQCPQQCHPESQPAQEQGQPCCLW